LTRRAAWVALAALSCGQTTNEPVSTAEVGGDRSGGSGFGGSSGDGGVLVGGAAGAPGGGAAAAPEAGRAAGDGGGPSSTEPTAWPGAEDVVTLDAAADFTSDLSGLTYESPGVLWAVNNLSSSLFRLVEGGAGYRSDASNGWASGKRLRFADGQGVPDAEGVTFAASSASGVYVSSERDLNHPEVSRLSVLRYDVSAPGATLDATHEWDVTALLPPVAPNAGIEAVTWVADSFLTAHGFRDESRMKPYSPADYGEHAEGLFVVGVEQTGKLYALVLEHPRGAATLVASISTSFLGVMGLEMDRDRGELWAHCDDTCGNRSAVLSLGASGRFEPRRLVSAPPGLPDSNHEGIALAPDSECSAGLKPFFWTDDADSRGFSLRKGALSCAVP
jgi:hypothetical protein